MIEDPRQRRRAQLDRSFQRLAIQNVVGSGCGISSVALLRVERIPQRKCGTKRPSLPLHRHRKRGCEIESAHHGASAEPNLAPLQTFRRALKRPVQRCISQLPLLAGEEETRRMQNPNQLRLRKHGAARVQFGVRIANFEVLIALCQGIEVKSVGRVGEKNLRPHFRVDRLRVNIGEGDAENERTQIIDICHAAERPERTLRRKTCILASLVLRRTADAAILDSHVAEEHVRVVARTSAEFSAFEPTAFGVVFGACKRIHAAIEDPVHGIAGNRSFGGRVAETRKQQPGLALLLLHRKRHKRKIEYRQTHQPEVAVVDFGGAVHIHRDAPRVELPFRTRQFAGGDRSLPHQVMVWPVSLHNFPGKGKRIGRGQHVAGIPHPKSYRSDCAVENSRFRADIVRAVTGLDVLVVRTTVQRDVALEFAVSGVRVVGDLIRVQDVIAIVDFRLAPQVINGPIFFLLHRPDRDLFFRLPGRRCRRNRGRRRSILGSRNRRCGRGQRLAGYYPVSEKQMTDQCDRDKDSRAGDH